MRRESQVKTATNTSMRWTALAALTVLVVGCDKGSGASTSTADSAPAVPASVPITTTPVSTAPATPSSAAPAASAGNPATCEVEVFGRVDIPKGTPGSGFVFVAQDDCLSPTANMLGHAPVKPDGGFFIEIFPKWGTDITICAAFEKPDGTTELYGKAVNKDNGGKFHAESKGEVEFEGVTVALKKGPSRKFARAATK